MVEEFLISFHTHRELFTLVNKFFPCMKKKKKKKKNQTHLIKLNFSNPDFEIGMIPSI